MTVICWDGKSLAGDKMSQNQWTKRAVRKVVRSRGGDALIGAAGDADRCRALIAWFDQGGDFPDHLRRSSETDATLLVVWRDGSCELYQREPFPIVLDGKNNQAIGSGAEAALVAMHCGKTAAEAVEVASLFCPGVGLGVDALEFE